MSTRTQNFMDYAMTFIGVVYYTGAIFYIGTILSNQYMLTLVP